MTRSFYFPLLLLLCLVFVAEAPHAGVTADYDNPADSPLWWTLTDELTPEQLRAIWMDTSLHRQRYEEAVAQGLAGPMSREGLEKLSFFLSSEQTPELIAMWQAFDSFARGLRNRPASEDRLVAGLREAGISEAALERILVQAHAHLYDTEKLAAEITDDALEFVRILRKRRSGLSRAEYRRATAGDLQLLAAGDSPGIGKLERLHATWRRDPSQESMAAKLPVLARELSPAEWNSLRQFLLTTTQNSMVDFDAD